MIVYGHSDADARDYFDFSINNNHTRSKGLKLRIERCKKSRRKNFSDRVATNVWNTLPLTVVTTRNVHCFKVLLENHLKDISVVN